jgi:rhomboid family GlyGly-CTERM serine protease
MNLKLIIAVLLISLLSFSMQWWQPDFLYIRNTVNQGEWWRIITGQLVHTNWPHFALNISSLVLFTLLFYNTITVRTFTISLFLLILSVGVCIHLFEPRIYWYAGLSGAIYGLYLIGANTAYRSGDKLVAIGVTILIIGKAVFDHWIGPIQDNTELIGARVVTESHLYGIATAIILNGFDKLYRVFKPTSQSN